MKTLYLDIFSGISGDMFIGAMLDLGLDLHRLEHELEKLGLEGYRLQVSRQERGAIVGTKFDVHLTHEQEHEHIHTHEHSHGQLTHTHAHSHAHSHEHEHSYGELDSHAHEHGAHHHHHPEGKTHGPHGGLLVACKGNQTGAASGHIELSVFETNVPPRFRLYFFDEHGHGIKPLLEKNVTLETIRGGRRRQLFRFKRHGQYLEATDELPEPHEFKAVLRIKRGARIEKLATQFVEDHHHHAGPEIGSPHIHGRTFTDIRALIQNSRLSSWVKEKAIAVFHRVAVAEGKIHGHPPEKVHFHEVGAVDSIVDIVGACLALEMLGKPRVVAGSVVEGVGTVQCAHGRFPLPAPATLEILSARRIRLQQCDEPQELITPTGAALLAEFAESFGAMEDLVVHRIGYGLGTRQNKTRPNVLRAILGETLSRAPVHDWDTDTITVLETNLDDIGAEILGAFVEKAFATGALDVFHTPVQMKKNRPGLLLTVLCQSADADRLTELLLRETSTFGVRRHTAERRKLKRELIKVQTPFGEVAVKVGRLDGQQVQTAPEYESCKQLAEQANVPLKQIYEAAIRAAQPGS